MASGEITLRNKVVRIDSVRDAMQAGIVLMPEDMQRDGLFPDLSIRENVVISANPKIVSYRVPTMTARVRELCCGVAYRRQ